MRLIEGNIGEDLILRRIDALIVNAQTA